jgi:hypothetical protein
MKAYLFVLVCLCAITSIFAEDLAKKIEGLNIDCPCISQEDLTLAKTCVIGWLDSKNEPVNCSLDTCAGNCVSCLAYFVAKCKAPDFWHDKLSMDGKKKLFLARYEAMKRYALKSDTSMTGFIKALDLILEIDFRPFTAYEFSQISMQCNCK